MAARNLPEIWPKGFKYIMNFISESQKQQLLSILEENQWCTHLQRQQQYYGIKYFQTKQIDSYLQPKQSVSHYPISSFNFIIEKIKRQLGVFQEQQSPNQILVNKYLKKDRLGVHVENVQAFGPVVVGLTLGSEDYLRLIPNLKYASLEERNRNEIKVLLGDRSIYVLSGIARYEWMHGISRTIEGKHYKSQNFQRISLTFRDVKQGRRKV